jgi:hypothetical protein
VKILEKTGLTRATRLAKPSARSRVSNGKDLFVGGVDGRTAYARRYRDILAQLTSDAGGDPSEAQAIIIRRATQLAVWCEMAEADAASGLSLNVAEYCTATNTLRRLLLDLGLSAGCGTSPDHRLVLGQASGLLKEEAPARWLTGASQPNGVIEGNDHRAILAQPQGIAQPQGKRGWWSMSLARHRPSGKLCILLYIASSGHGACLPSGASGAPACRFCEPRP